MSYSRVDDGKCQTDLNRVRQIFIQDHLRAGVPVPVPNPAFKYCPTCSYHVQTDNRTQLCPDCKTECWELHGEPAQGKSYAHALLECHFGPDYNNLHPEASDDKSLSEQVPEASDDNKEQGKSRMLDIVLDSPTYIRRQTNLDSDFVFWYPGMRPYP